MSNNFMCKFDPIVLCVKFDPIALCVKFNFCSSMLICALQKCSFSNYLVATFVFCFMGYPHGCFISYFILLY
jgi:hypothetical protein